MNKQWKACLIEGACYYDGVCSDGWVIEGPDYVPDYEQPMLTESDAKLMAAAPELLASLRELVAYCEELGFDLLCMAQAKSTITKATTVSGKELKTYSYHNEPDYNQ